MVIATSFLYILMLSKTMYKNRKDDIHKLLCRKIILALFWLMPDVVTFLSINPEYQKLRTTSYKLCYGLEWKVFWFWSNIFLDSKIKIMFFLILKTENISNRRHLTNKHKKQLHRRLPRGRLKRMVVFVTSENNWA